MHKAPPDIDSSRDRTCPRRQISSPGAIARRHSWALVLIGLLTTCLKADEFEFFETKIRPVLVEHCYPCHSFGSEKLRGGLRLDSREEMRRGGESGQPAIVPGDVAKSRLLTAIRYDHEDLRMPPPKREPLSPERVADFVAWVKQGAPDPRVGAESSRTSASSRENRPATNHWAFRPS